MSSNIVIGCKHCEQKLTQKYGYTIQYNKDLLHPFPIYTAYKIENLLELLEDYTCLYCGNRLKITPTMFKFITTFFDKRFHIEATHNSIDISNGELSFALPIHKEIHSVQQFLSDFGITLLNADDFLPTKEDIKLIQDATKDYDHSQWLFRLESDHTLAPYINTNNLWFNF